MNEAKKIEYQGPKFKAIKKDNPDKAAKSWEGKKKWKMETDVLVAWIVLIAMAFMFWYFLLKLL